MSSPASSTKPSQLSIRSFFKAGSTPKYAPPPAPSQTVKKPTDTDVNAAPAPVPVPAPAPASPSRFPAAVPPPQPLPPLPTTLPREASIRLVSLHDLNALRRINALLLPVSYPDYFYDRAVDPAFSGRFSRVITWQHSGEEPKVVGGVVCRLDPAPEVLQPGQKANTLYIQSLCLLAPYRSLGLVNAALDNIVIGALADETVDIKVVTAHVWTENEEGMQWYEARGFKRDGSVIQSYYVKLRPGSAWLIRREASTFLQQPSQYTAAPSPLRSRPVPPSTTAAVVNLPPRSDPSQNADTRRPPVRGPASAQSFQNQRPDMEWNDLPTDMAPDRLAPPRSKGGSEPGSTASSRSSSRTRKKRERSYPTEAFGGLGQG